MANSFFEVFSYSSSCNYVMISISCLALTRASHTIDSHRTQLISTVITNYSHIAPGHGCAHCALIHCCEVILVHAREITGLRSLTLSSLGLLIGQHFNHSPIQCSCCLSIIFIFNFIIIIIFISYSRNFFQKRVLIVSCHGYIFMSRFSVIKTIKRKTDRCCSMMLPWHWPDINKLHKHAHVPQVSLRQHPTRSNDFIQSRNRNTKGLSAWNEWMTGCSVHLGVKCTSANNRICSVNLFDDHLTFNYSFCPPGALMDFLFWP